MSNTITERRKHERIGIIQPIYLEILQSGNRRSTSIDVIKCETVDVSIEGLCIYVPMEIEPGTRLNIAVPEANWIENLELSAQARWIRKAKDGQGFWLGLELQDTSRENMEKWFKTVSLLRKQKDAS
ncbi:MAG: PilZ domain-containing protein [Halioglobus sp.]